MNPKIRRILTIVMLVIVVLVVATLLAGAIAKANMARQNPAPGQLVDVGGYKMHIYCTGQGSPTVIMAAGFSEFSTTWAYVQPEVARFTRVCVYDRAGMGRSEPGKDARTATNMVKELHTLLANAQVEGPYLLVGHSMGGMLLRVYAFTYPEQVAGLVLVDSQHEDLPARFPKIQQVNEAYFKSFNTLSLLSSLGLMALMPQTIPDPPLPQELFAQYRTALATGWFFETTLAELNTMGQSTAEVRALQITSLGDLPLIVLSAGQYTAFPAFSDAENQDIWQALQEFQTRLATLSTNSQQIIAEKSGHFVHHDQPELVIGAIQELVAVSRK